MGTRTYSRRGANGQRYLTEAGRARQIIQAEKERFNRGGIANEPVSKEFFAKGGKFYQNMRTMLLLNFGMIANFNRIFDATARSELQQKIQNNELRIDEMIALAQEGIQSDVVTNLIVTQREMDGYGIVMPASEMRTSDEIETLPNGMKAIGFRGVNDNYDYGETGNYIEQLRNGSFYMGKGIYGSGVYVSMPPLNGEIAGSASRRPRPITPQEALELAYWYADYFGRYRMGDSVAIGLRKGAKTNIPDLERYDGDSTNENATSAKQSLEKILWDFTNRYGFRVEDPAIAAAALGYDAIVTIGNGSQVKNTYQPRHIRRAQEVSTTGSGVHWYEDAPSAKGAVLHIAFLNRRAMIISSANDIRPSEVL